MRRARCYEGNRIAHNSPDGAPMEIAPLIGVSAWITWRMAGAQSIVDGMPMHVLLSQGRPVQEDDPEQRGAQKSPLE